MRDQLATLSQAERARRFTKRLSVIAVLAFVLRIVLQRFEPPPPLFPDVADERWYVGVARQLSHFQGVWLPWSTDRAPSALHGPLTSIVLVPSVLLDPNGFAGPRATMAVLGAVTVVLVGLVARELGGDRVALVAAALCAIYPGIWVNDLLATSESPALVLLCLIILLSLRYLRRPSWGKVLALGVLVGLLTLDRGEWAVLALVIIGCVLVRVVLEHRRAPSAIAGIAVVLVLAAVTVAPWSIYNETRFQKTVLVSTDLGQTLIGANCSQSYYGRLTGFNGTTCFFPTLVALHHAHPHADESVADGFLRNAAEHYALHHWHRLPIVAVFRELWLWSLWSPGWVVHMAGLYIGRPSWMTWLQIACFWLLTPFAIYGAVVMRRRRAMLWVPGVMVGFAAVLGLVIVGNLRYRLPAELAFVLLGAFAFEELWSRWRTSRGAEIAAATT